VNSDEENVSTQQAQTSETLRIQSADGLTGRPQGFGPQKSEGQKSHFRVKELLHRNFFQRRKGARIR
jgi:hypothetical protein